MKNEAIGLKESKEERVGRSEGGKERAHHCNYSIQIKRRSLTNVKNLFTVQ